MRRVAAIAGAVSALAAGGLASAEDWYTLDLESAAITISVAEHRDAGPRVWFRYNVVADGERADTRVLLDVSCATRSAAMLEARRFDSEGQEVGSARNLANEPLDPHFAGRVADVACSYRPLERSPRRLDETATPKRVAQALRADGDPAERAQAMEAVLTEPGAFPPLTFVYLASALYEDGRHDEAFAWFAFGHVRLTTDMRAAIRADERYAEAANLFYPMYGFSASYELDVARNALSEARWMELTREAIARDASTPRYYPLNWYMASVAAEDVAWGYEQSPLPGTDFDIRAQLDAEREELSSAAQ